ncbi:MAG: hypothetical protein BWY71_00997 [Planctomycetes bacterium ADurb.Bin412]|nr:MAG: hypothetical protein BWY71_00997 [Planctomycetes bacterium ADurb.Bin412]
MVFQGLQKRLKIPPVILMRDRRRVRRRPDRPRRTGLAESPADFRILRLLPLELPDRQALFHINGCPPGTGNLKSPRLARIRSRSTINNPQRTAGKLQYRRRRILRFNLRMPQVMHLGLHRLHRPH